jgi:hypothetical protein
MYGNRDSGIWKFRVIDGEDGDQGQYCGISINPRNGAPSAAYYDASNGGIVWTEGMVLY